jgi:nucleoside-diphosphate-sugar epimerase
MERVLVTGGAGYVGSALVPALLKAGYRVRVLDLYIFGPRALQPVAGHPNLEQIKGDIRERDLLKVALRDCRAVIHLAAISNDPSFELNPLLGRTINFDAFEPLVKIARASGVRRFIYASTSSVYGLSDRTEVTEEHPLVPLTDYNKYKGLCEPILLREQAPDFTTIVVRPATVCGYAPRQRLDLTVNILTAHAHELRRITVLGGAQMRPNIHIRDLVELYLLLLRLPAARVAGQIYNAGWQNHTVAELARTVSEVVSARVPGRGAIEIVTAPSDDRRSYHISSNKLARELDFVPSATVADAVNDLVAAFAAGKLPNALHDQRYYNVATMLQAGLR